MNTKKRPTVLRWFCPKCDRAEPRHRLTRVIELPPYHTRPHDMGQPIYDSARMCDGIRQPQSYDWDRAEWRLDTEPLP
jgi:hypothetical protein